MTLLRKLKMLIRRRVSAGVEVKRIELERTEEVWEPRTAPVLPEPPPSVTRPRVEMLAPVIKRYTLKGRLIRLLNSPEILFKFRDSDIAIQMLAGGVPIYIKTYKERGHKFFKIEEGRISNPDVFVKITEDFARALADARSLIEMVRLIREELERDEYTRRIKIRLLRSLDELKKKGYFNLDLFKVLVLG